MNQIFSPNGDIETGNWQTPPLYSKLNEVIPNDSTAIESDDLVDSDQFEVSLSPLSWPQSGTQTLYIRLLGIDATALDVVLLQHGVTEIAGLMINIPGSTFQTYSVALSLDQIALITDYTALSVRVTKVCAIVG